MEEKILMRIHDDENDCDLVSVKNPLGHFGMSIFAEKNGDRKPVDGMHMLAKMIEQVGNGSGGSADAIILVKQEAGNYVGEIVFGDYADVSQKIVNHQGVNVQIMHEFDDPEYGEYVYRFYFPMSITATGYSEGGTPYSILFAFDGNDHFPFDFVQWNPDGSVDVW